MTQQIRIIRASALACGLWLVGSLAGWAQAPTDPSKVDIMGFHLGMVPDEVKQVATAKIPSVAFDIRQGTLSMGTYKTQPLVFGVEASTGRDPGLGVQPGKDYLFFVFDQRPPYKTVSIIRKTAFTQDAAPTIKQMIASLTEKYGQPAGIEDLVGGQTKIVWTYDSKVKFEPKKNMTHLGCTLAIGQMGEAGALFQGSFGIRNDGTGSPDCGTWMAITIRASGINPQIVGNFDVEIGDMKAMRESIQYTLDTLKKGAEGSAADERTRAAGNKPNL